MKAWKKIWAAALALCLALSLCSCDLSGLTLLLKGHTATGEDTSFVPDEITDVIKTDFETCYADQLSPNEKAVYDAVVAARVGEHEFVVTFAEMIEVTKGKAPDKEKQDEVSALISYTLSNALFAAWLDTPSLFWLETGNYSYSYNIEPHPDDVYRVKDVTLKVELKEAYAENPDHMKYQLDTLLEGLSLRGANDVKTIENINRYLCNKITYTDTEYRESIYGALINGKCVCEGYAHAFQLLCQKYGIVCTSIVGDGVTEEGSEGHMWNAVLLDGKWYAVDVTWNDTTESRDYLLVGTSTVSHKKSFDESHIPYNRRGAGKAFALPGVVSRGYYE